MSGLLHFSLTEAKSYKFIQIRLHGGALVRWTETYTTGSGQSQRTHTVTYKSEETYVNQAIILWSNEQTPHRKIGPGTFDLPFQFVIPAHCLGSFEGSVGSIRYGLHAHIKTGLLHRDHNIEVPIQVNRVRDINIPQLMAPVNQSKHKQVGFFCFGSNVDFTVSLSCTGFCIGHNLPLTVNVENGSSRRIKMRASVQRLCNYHAQGHTRFDKRKIVTVTSPHISPHSQYIWSVEDLVVPMVEPSFTESAIIKMQYFLKVTAVIPWAKNSSVMIPITIGNVPLNSSF